MNNNDIFKKLRVALMLRDDQIVSILELVDFRISKGELGNIFRSQDHADYMECGDQILRNFLNGLVIHLRGTKENPKNPNDVLAIHKAEAKPKPFVKTNSENTVKGDFKTKKPFNKKPFNNSDSKKSKTEKIQVIEKVKFKNGKKSNN